MELFPVEVNKAPYEMLLRVPGIGVTSALRIVKARRMTSLDFAGLKKLGVVLKRAQYFITCRGRVEPGVIMEGRFVQRILMAEGMSKAYGKKDPRQLTLFDVTAEDVTKCLTGQI
jgi:predicted DNA-binding helix-hairpin-helix protein